MPADPTPDLADESRAGHFFRVETRDSTVTPWRKIRSFLVGLVSSAVQLTGPTTWPPVDIVLVDLSTGFVIRRWHEGGEEAASLLEILSADLITMGPEEFIEKWTFLSHDWRTHLCQLRPALDRFRSGVRGTKLSMATARFDPELRSATEARRFVEDELRAAGAGEDTLCHAQLLVTELVTNAARHAHSAVDLTIAGQHGHVRIEARDESSAIPIAPRIDTETRHRGLQLIEDLSEGWGVDVHGDDGKIVWCELASTGLARREREQRRA